jgi:ABC-type oligopeptide transport system substrate-binding subunit
MPPCLQLAATIRRDLAPLGIALRTVPLPSGLMFERAIAPHARFDIMTLGWVMDHLDPLNVLAPLFTGTATNYSHFHDAYFTRAITAAARLSGPARSQRFAALAAWLARDAVPAVPYEVDATHDFFSARVGCQIDQPVYGIDLTALCLRH